MRRRIMIELIRIPSMANIYQTIIQVYNQCYMYGNCYTFHKTYKQYLVNILLEKLQASEAKRVCCAVESLQGCPGPRAGCLPGSCKGVNGRPWEDILTLLPCGHCSKRFHESVLLLYYLGVRLAKHADVCLVCVQKLASAGGQSREDIGGVRARHLDHRGRRRGEGG